MIRNKKTAILAAAALTLCLALSFPAVRTAAVEFLSVFRVNSLHIVNISPQDLQALEEIFQQGKGDVDIDSFGQIEVTGQQQRIPVSLTEAAQAVDFPLRLPDLAGYTLDGINLETGFTVTMTLSVENINKGLQALGGNKKLPEQLEGQSFSIVVPARITADYSYDDAYLYISQFSLPEIKVPAGVDVEELRRALLDIPVLPDNLRQQMLAVKDPLTTLMVPNINGSASNININGADGVLLLGEDTAPGELMLVWPQNDVFNMIFGSGLDREKALAIAAQMK